MKKLLALGLVALMAGSVSAQLDETIGMGIFFNNALYTDATTNFNPTAGVPFDAHVVLLTEEGSGLTSVAAYECFIEFSQAVFVLSVGGPNGWTNFGNSTNHIAGYSTPVAVTNGSVVLGSLNCLYAGAERVDITMGPATPSSFGGEGPGISDGANVDDLYVCVLTSGYPGSGGGLVATLNGPGVVSSESRSLSDIKALFN